MSALDETAVFIREPEASDPLPEGWVAAPLWWHGRPMEVVFDPVRVQVASFATGSLNDEIRRRLPDVGWRHAAADGEGIELWLADRAGLQTARLDRLARGASAPAAALGTDIS